MNTVNAYWVHKISNPSYSVEINRPFPLASLSDPKSLGAALRAAGIFWPGCSVRDYRVERSDEGRIQIVVFPRNPSCWHALIMTVLS